METKIISDIEEFRALQEAWDELLKNSWADTVYLTWEWLFTWWEIYGDSGRKLHIVALYENNRLIAVGPFIIRRKIISKLFTSRVLEFLGTGEDERDEVCSNYMNVIIREGHAKAYRAIFEEIIKGFRREDWEEVHLRNVPVRSGMETIFDPSLTRKFIIKIGAPVGCAVIELPASWDEYFQNLSKGWRDQIKRGRKEVAAKGEVQTDSVDDPQLLPQAFEEFIELHQQKWQSQGETGLFTSFKFREFHKKILEVFSKKRWAAVRRLRCGDRTVAASYKFQYNGVVYFYLPAYDVNFKTKIGLGLIERSYDIEEAIAQKFKYYDFYKAGKGSYKWHLAKSNKEVVDIFIHKRGFKYYLLWLIKAFNAVCRRIKKLCLGSHK